MTNKKYLQLLKDAPLQMQCFRVLSDKKFHCRKCAFKNIDSGQPAGGGGIDGLKDGTKSRPGLMIVKESRYCDICMKKTSWDRWTGEYIKANPAQDIPKKLQMRVRDYYNNEDAIEQRKRKDNQLVVDHRFPKIRRGGIEIVDSTDMSSEDIKEMYQLLKKDDSGNHNKLKAEACIKCFNTGKRGKPLGINFYYRGNENWSNEFPPVGEGAKAGCIGCGWYDFNEWRNSLNAALSRKKG